MVEREDPVNSIVFNPDQLRIIECKIQGLNMSATSRELGKRYRETAELKADLVKQVRKVYPIGDPMVSALLIALEAGKLNLDLVADIDLTWLTEEERSALDMLKERVTRRQVGDRLALPETTIEGRLQRAFRKLEIHNKYAAIAAVYKSTHTS